MSGAQPQRISYFLIWPQYYRLILLIGHHGQIVYRWIDSVTIAVRLYDFYCMDKVWLLVNK